MSVLRLLQELMDIFDNPPSNNIDRSNIFKDLESSECIIPSTKYHISNCNYLQRIAAALQYYQLICQNIVPKKQLIQFCQEIYTNFLDDYYHFIKCHHSHIKSIREELHAQYSIEECNINQCGVITRHYRSECETTYRTIQNEAEFDVNVNEDILCTFYEDCFDRIHHHINHLHRIGMRIENRETTETIDDTMSDGIDEAFKAMRKIIFDRRREFGSNRYERLQCNQNKFNVVIMNKSSEYSIKSGNSCSLCI